MTEKTELPADVVRLVLAARAVAFSGHLPTNEEAKELDQASEAFAGRVPWGDEPVPLTPETFVVDYEFRLDDGGGYTPTPDEKAMIVDAIHGYLTEMKAQPAAQDADQVGPAEKEVGRAVYERIETLSKSRLGRWGHEEYEYLTNLTASVEELGAYDGPDRVPQTKLGEIEAYADRAVVALGLLVDAAIDLKMDFVPDGPYDGSKGGSIKALIGAIRRANRIIKTNPVKK